MVDLVYLLPYDFTIRHRPGKLNPADAPSRSPDYIAQPRADNSSWHHSLMPTLEARWKYQMLVVSRGRASTAAAGLLLRGETPVLLQMGQSHWTPYWTSQGRGRQAGSG
jgi:hypothetical protein